MKILVTDLEEFPPGSDLVNAQLKKYVLCRHIQIYGFHEHNSHASPSTPYSECKT